MAHAEHAKSAEQIVARCAVVTLSDTRSASTDTSGATIQRLLAEQGHQTPFYQVIPDEPATLERLLGELLARGDVDAILTNGGTGVSRRDQTIGVMERTIEQPLPGFGELFRMLSYQQVGSAAMLSRAAAGIARGKLLFALPGSPRAVELAMTRLVLPELRHLLYELSK